LKPSNYAAAVRISRLPFSLVACDWTVKGVVTIIINYLATSPTAPAPFLDQNPETVTCRLTPSSHCLIWSRTVPHHRAPHHQVWNCQRRSAPEAMAFEQHLGPQFVSQRAYDLRQLRFCFAEVSCIRGRYNENALYWRFCSVEGGRIWPSTCRFILYWRRSEAI